LEVEFERACVSEPSHRLMTGTQQVEWYFKKHHVAVPTRRAYETTMQHARLFVGLTSGIVGANLMLHVTSAQMDRLGVFSLAPNALLDKIYATAVKNLLNKQHSEQIDDAARQVEVLAEQLGAQLSIDDSTTTEAAAAANND
jgi:hypothetical protein